MCVRVYTCIYIHIYMIICIYIYIYIDMIIYIYIHMYLCIHINIYKRIYNVYIYICVTTAVGFCNHDSNAGNSDDNGNRLIFEDVYHIIWQRLLSFLSHSIASKFIIWRRDWLTLWLFQTSPW